MPNGTVLFPRYAATNHVDDVIEQARRAHALGVRQIWLAQQFDHDAIALAGLVGAAVPGLGVGTSVVPINPRHPLVTAGLAQTAQAASHGNFTSASVSAVTGSSTRPSGWRGRATSANCASI